MSARKSWFHVLRVAVVVVLIGGADSARAEGSEGGSPDGRVIDTDRPTVSRSSRVVGAGRWQLELGLDFALESTRFGDGRSVGLPTKLRFGLTDRVELHLESDVFRRVGVDAPSGIEEQISVADVDIGGKYHLREQDRAKPSLGVLAAITLPIAEGDATTWSGAATLAADWALASWSRLGASVGVTSPFAQRDVRSELIRWATVLDFDLPLLEGQMSAFIEGFGQLRTEDWETAVSAQLGLAVLVTEYFQLDATMRFGVTGPAEDSGFGLGVSYLH